jgi:esterase/lipase/carbon monoxide dehydrogenase subunit G
MIEVNESFVVAAPPADVYQVMSDPHAVVECVAGAALGERSEDGSYVGTMTVKFSALRVSFSGRIVLDLDQPNLAGTVVATGRDRQGGTKFKATASFTVAPDGDDDRASQVTVVGDIDLSGKLASVIEGAAGTVVRRMTNEFVAALSLRCASDSTSLGEVSSATSSVANAAPAEPATPGPAAPTPGILLLHDFGASPNGMRDWGDHLASTGAVVRSPRLPGHGTRGKDLDATAWQQWYDAARAAVVGLRDTQDRVVVMGVSLGATLALRMAQEHPEDIAGVVAVNPVLTGLIGAKRWLGVRRLVRRSRPAVVSDAKKPGVRDIGYDRVPLAAAGSLIALGGLVRAGMARVGVPVLLALSAVDHVVDRADGEAVWTALPVAHRRRIDLGDSYHLAVLDNDAAQLFAASAEFVRDVTAVTVARR